MSDVSTLRCPNCAKKQLHVGPLPEALACRACGAPIDLAAHAAPAAPPPPIAPRGRRFPLWRTPLDPADARTVDEFTRSLARVTPRAAVTRALILLNGAVFLAMVLTDVDLLMGGDVATYLAWGANYAPKTSSGEPWRILTAMFLHGGGLHLVMNMTVLWGAGQLVERLFGGVAFAVLYFVAGLCGSLATLLMRPDVVSVGASGAIFGVYGALFGFILRRGKDSVPAPVLKPIRSGAIFFLVVNLALGFVIPQVDVSAHVGGLLGGLACGLLLARPLTAEGTAGRLPRAAALAAAGLAFVAIALALLPEWGDVQASVERFRRVESRVVGPYQGIRLTMQRNGGRSGALGVMVEDLMLAPWREARADLAAVGRVPGRIRPFYEALLAYAEAREAEFDACAAALRTGSAEDRKRLEEAEAKTAKAKERLSEVVDGR